MIVLRRLLAALIAAAATGLLGAAGAAAQVTVSPQPGTIKASPSTQLSFRGVAPDALGEITVRGSRSGAMAGRIRAHSDGQGASWLARRPFRGGEKVTVRTKLPLTGGRSGDFRFLVGRFPARATIQNRILEDIPPGTTLRYRSRPDLAPPKVTVSGGPRAPSPGHVFLTPKSKLDLKQAGPMIVDSSGEPVWWRPLHGILAATDFRAQTYRGRPVLTYWEGTSRQGIGTGELVMLDQTYDEIKRIRFVNGFRPDLHEFRITPQDTGLLISYPIVRVDLSGVGGVRNGLVVDSVIQEIDLETGLVLFEWHSLGKIALRESFTAPVRSSRVPWDYVHANAVSVDADGNLLVSARSTWAAYKIDRRTGAVLWRLGGKRSDFALGPGVRFAWQHDVQRRADGAITLFDNSAFPPVRKRSRALAVVLDEQARTATLQSARIHPRGLLAATQGNAQNLPGGGMLVGWGSQRYFTEYDAAGAVVWDARVALGFESYRAYRLPWVGTPKTRPRAAGVRLRDGAMHVYASWNGATEVASWEVLAGATAGSLAPVAAAPRSGFETRIRVPAAARYVAVRAKDASGAILRASPPARVHR
jgi:hypothetical protein